MDKRKIVIDCFGCDSPEEVIRGAALAAEKYPGVELILTGEKKSIEDTLGREKSFPRIRIADAAEVIGNEESPVNAIRRKKDSSLVAALRILKEEEDACAMISAGSTGAVLCGAVMLLGRCEGVERPALASLLPADNGGFVCLADCGANADCRPEQLAAFARHASAYVESLGVKTPRVGLLSVGTEEGKGNALVKETFPLLKESGLHFIGNVEAKSALSGEVDVIVSDGFSGNVLLKSMEGTAKSVLKRLAAALKKHAPEGSGGFIGAAFADVMKTLDFNAQGAAVLLGVKKTVLKAHGSAVAETIVSCVRQILAMQAGGFDKFLTQRGNDE